MAKLLDALDDWQRRHRTPGFVLALFKRFGEHRGQQLAATVSYYSFFSVFPLMLAFVTILGLVLEDDQELRDRLVDSALGRIPVVGQQIANSSEPLTGSGWVLAVGLATAIWAGLGAVNALQLALDELWDVPVHRRPGFVPKHARGIAFLALFAVGLAASAFLTGVASFFDLGTAASTAGFVATALVNTLILLMTFTVLPAERRPWRHLLPGAAAGGVLLALLLQFGQLVFGLLEGASDTYGTFAIVIGLLGWFHLVSRVVLLSAMVGDVAAGRLWPRSLRRDGPLTDADRRASLLDVQRVQRDPRFGFALAVGDTTVGTESGLEPDGAAVTGPAARR